MQLVGDAFIGEADEFSKRRVRPAGPARQRWNEARQRREGMSINRPQIDGLRRMAGRATHPQKQLLCLKSGGQETTLGVGRWLRSTLMCVQDFGNF
jgi:hypothetical protein